MTVSVVIPTRNRTASLHRLLTSLGNQSRLPAEVIVVDSSEQPAHQGELQEKHPRLVLRVLLSSASVCRQRNIGIREAQSTYIFLCDDDMEVPADYLLQVTNYLEANPDAGAVTGVVLEPDDRGRFNNGSHPVSFASLVSHFVFQHTVWMDLNQLRVRFPWSLLYRPIRRFYDSRGNTFTLAGWPLLTRIEVPVMSTSIYGLGGSICRKDWLVQSPFDETLGEHGIGDNYGVALGFPGDQPITVLTDIRIYHHKIDQNRLPRGEAYMRRVLALDYFMSRDQRFSWSNRILLRWSVLGNIVGGLVHGQDNMTSAAFRTLTKLLARWTRVNPAP